MDAKPKQEKEDLREFYITPLYLNTMRQRAKSWSEDFINRQLLYFQKTIPDYPEVHEILQTELHTRKLNQLHKAVRKMKKNELTQLMQKYKSEPDHCEVIQTELEIRSGADFLVDLSGETNYKNTNARIV